MSESSGWQLASGSVAEASERYLMSTFGYAWTQALVQLAAPQEGDRVLDVACGTGPVARHIAPFVGSSGRVVGLDLNSGMLDTARAMPTPEGIPIEWREGNATALPFLNASFDVVCCQQGLQFFPDRPTALREMHRVLAPVGRLALAVWRGLEHQPFYASLTEALERYVGSEAAASLSAAFTLRDRNDIRELVAQAGFRDIRIRIRSRLTRYPSLAEYVLGYLSGTPMCASEKTVLTAPLTASNSIRFMAAPQFSCTPSIVMRPLARAPPTESYGGGSAGIFALKPAGSGRGEPVAYATGIKMRRPIAAGLVWCCR